MPHSEAPRTNIADVLGGLKVFGGLVLLAAISWEVITGSHDHFSAPYLHIQLAVCILFLSDFFIRWGSSRSRGKFVVHNLFYLLISIPYLNLVVWSGKPLTHEWGMFIGLIPMARAFMAFQIVIRWLVAKRISRVFAAYVLSVVVVTYLAALVFYDYETPVNPHLGGFGDALWWAWMNVTTVGAEVFAVTTIGKVMTVILPTLGMMMFPIFTTYIMERFQSHKKEKDDQEKSY